MNSFFKKIFDSQFLIRVIKKEITQEERETFEKWLDERDENREEFGQIALLWDKLGKLPTPPSPDPDVEWGKFQKKLKEFDQTSEEKVKIFRVSEEHRQSTFASRIQKRIWYYRAAAIILISILVFQLIPREKLHQEIVQKINNEKYEFTTQKGERATFILSDGTIIYLNAQSKLIYPKYFDENYRMVELEGEAYFSVKSIKNYPFIVKTGNNYTEVRGTEFNIKFRKNRLNLVVTKGKVVIYNETKAKFVNVKPGELVLSSDDVGITNPIPVDTKLYTAWRENKLSFIKTPFEDVLEEIDRFYNVNSICKNKKALNKTLTGYFESNSLDDVLLKISIALDVNITRNGNTIYVD